MSYNLYTSQNLKQNKFIKFKLPKRIFRITNNNIYTKKGFIITDYNILTVNIISKYLIINNIIYKLYLV